MALDARTGLRIHPHLENYHDLENKSAAFLCSLKGIYLVRVVHAFAPKICRHRKRITPRKKLK
jgi:hypothetical protein